MLRLSLSLGFLSTPLLHLHDFRCFHFPCAFLVSHTIAFPLAVPSCSSLASFVPACSLSHPALPFPLFCSPFPLHNPTAYAPFLRFCVLPPSLPRSSCFHPNPPTQSFLFYPLSEDLAVATPLSGQFCERRRGRRLYNWPLPLCLPATISSNFGPRPTRHIRVPLFRAAHEPIFSEGRLGLKYSRGFVTFRMRNELARGPISRPPRHSHSRRRLSLDLGVLPLPAGC